MNTRLLMLSCLLGAAAPAQRDILSPFRDPAEHFAPPDAVYRALRTMQAVAQGVGRGAVRFDEDGVEVCDHRDWQAAYEQLQGLRDRGYAGYLAQIMRRSNSPLDRATAFYGAFYDPNPDYVLNLIGHIPGEPVRGIREDALRRAIPYVRAFAGRKFGDLSAEEQEALRAVRPKVGSPAAQARGITEDLQSNDFLFLLNLKPFMELMQTTAPIDRAQAAWFLKEVAHVRPGLITEWLRPNLGMVRTGCLAMDPRLQGEMRGLVAALSRGPHNAPPGTATEEMVNRWLDLVLEEVFPPIHRVAEGLVEIYPGKQRDRLVEVGRDLLRRRALGRFTAGKLPNGERYWGIEIGRLEDPLGALGVAVGAVITAINGEPLREDVGLLDWLVKNLEKDVRTFTLEFVSGGKRRAIEYRLR